ncbi:MAG TPA: alpha/beta hydrolase [Acidimicrobiales bacterium]|nr:alpha/beta hydrolase [Acidimicrobiales bacterium]
MADWSESDINVPDGRLHVYRRGAGRPVLLAHGATDNGRCWERVAGALEDAFELIAYDARGHGLSTDVVEGRRPGEDLVAVVEGLALERPAAMGHSMGAGAVCEAITMRPDLFAAAVLEDPGWGFTPPRPESAEAGERIRTLTGWVESLQRMTLAEVVTTGRTQNPDWHEADLPAWAESKLQYRPRMGGRGGGGTTDWRERVKAFACPVLLVCGAPGQALVSPETAAEAVALSPLVEAVAFDTGHNVRREAFDGFVAAVTEFLRKNID